MLGIPFIVIFTRDGREPAHKNDCGALAENDWTPLLYIILANNGVDK
jgi:hypothetical protein